MKAKRILEYEKTELKLVYDTLKEQFQRLQMGHDRLSKCLFSFDTFQS